jgi:hypothetical protein
MGDYVMEVLGNPQADYVSPQRQKLRGSRRCAGESRWLGQSPAGQSPAVTEDKAECSQMSSKHQL